MKKKDIIKVIIAVLFGCIFWVAAYKLSQLNTSLQDSIINDNTFEILKSYNFKLYDDSAYLVRVDSSKYFVVSDHNGICIVKHD